MVKNINPSFVEYFAGYLKKLLTDKKTDGTITADDFQGKVTDALNSFVKEEYGIDPAKWRTIAAQSSPEEECRAAILARILHGIKPNPDRRITHYRTQAEIYKATNKPTLDRAKADHSDANMNVNGLKLNADDWKSKTNMLLPDPTLGGKKRQMAVDFEPTSAVYCGECWICKTDVMSYTGKSYNWYDNDDNVVKPYEQGADQIEGTTPCGDCEHVAAIMASYIAGMLKSGGFSKFYWASYYVACVECNRRKSNKIGVKLHATKGWEVDHDGVNAIVNAIFPDAVIQTHVSEYNPIRNALGKKYNSMSVDDKNTFRAGVYDNIASGTQTWCDAANEQMVKSKASSTMARKFGEIIAAITVNLGIATKNLQKMKTKTVAKLAKGKTPSGKGNAVKAARPMIAKQPLPNKLKKRTGGAPPNDEYIKEGGNDEYILFTGDLTKLPRIAEEEGTQVEEEGTQVKEEGTKVEEDEDVDEDEYAAYLEAIISTFMDWVKSQEYISQLYDLYVIESDTFEMLIARLLHSMEEILISSHDIKEVVVPDIAAEPTAMAGTTELVSNLGQELPGRRTVTDEGAAELDIPNQSRFDTGLLPNLGPRSVTKEPDKPAEPGMTTPTKLPLDNQLSTVTPDGPVTGQNSGLPLPSSSSSVSSVTPSHPPNPPAKRPLSPPAGSNLFSLPTVGDSQDLSQVEEPAGNKSFKREETATPSRGPVIGPEDGTQPTGFGGGRLNKGHSKNNSQTHKQKNRTKRVSYIKHKQTRKNQHSRKTK